MVRMAAESTGFSIAAIRELEAEGFAKTRVLGSQVTQLAGALEAVSLSMQCHLAIRSVDSLQSLTIAAGNLKALLNASDGTGVI